MLTCLECLAVAVEYGFAVIHSLLVGPEELSTFFYQHPESGTKGLESHPVGESASHQVDRLRHLERAHLRCHQSAIELRHGVVHVGANAADEVGLGMDQRAEEIVQPK